MCSTESVSVDPSAGGGGVAVTADVSPTVGKLSDANNNHQRNPNRRSNKPIMEKRRRARINNCLNELKGILLEAMRKDPARHSKLEKADILELTVSHLKSLHRNDTQVTPSAGELLSRYRAGFAECAAEVGRFLTSPKAEGMEPSSTARLIAHLNDCLNSSVVLGGGTIPPSSSPSRTTPLPMLSTMSNGGLSTCSGDTSLNGGQQLPSNTPIISLLPSRLPSGEIAFVVPGFTSLRNGIQIHSSSSSHHHQNFQSNQHYQPLLSPEVPLELTVSSAHPHSHHHHHHHGGSTSSPSSSTSSLSPAYSYAPIAHAHHSSSPFYNSQQASYYQNQSQQPLALVTPKRDMADLSCWRPW